MWDELCAVLHQVDEAWLDHREYIMQLDKIFAQDTRYEEFLFSIESYIVQYKNQYRRFAFIEYILYHSLRNLDKHPDSNLKSVSNKVKFNIDQERKMTEHESIMNTSISTIERSMVILRRTSQPAHKMWRLTTS
jgi:hypothetical protein